MNIQINIGLFHIIINNMDFNNNIELLEIIKNMNIKKILNY